MIGIEVIGKDLHTEALQDANQYLSDFARTDHTEGLAIHIEAHKTIEREVPITCTPRGTLYLAVE